MVIGTGLIGGSVGMALRARGWHVTGTDADPGHGGRGAVALGALDDEGRGPRCRPRSWWPPRSVAAEVIEAILAATRRTRLAVVTDVAA